MKLLIRFFFICLFAVTVSKAGAQNEYFLTEYIKMKPGITDTASVMNYIRNRIATQESKFHSVMWSYVWQVTNPARSKNQYDYVITTLFKSFTDWLSEYKNSDSKGIFYSLTKGRLDSASMHKSDSFDIVYTPISELYAATGSLAKQPQLLLVKYRKATPGKERSYESLELNDWLPIHQDIIKKKYETAWYLNKLIFPERSEDYNYSTLTFFNDDAMYEKQADIDYDPYIRANQSAFINTGTLSKEVFSEMFKLLAVVQGEK